MFYSTIEATFYHRIYWRKSVKISKAFKLLKKDKIAINCEEWQQANVLRNVLIRNKVPICTSIKLRTYKVPCCFSWDYVKKEVWCLDLLNPIISINFQDLEI
jgi:hypothetical protein